MQLGNHLGNVLTVISDRNFGVSSGGSLTLPNGATIPAVDYYDPDMLAANDYYPFGMLSRTFGTSDRYRFGFNGKEADNEVKGRQNQQDYGMRIYDPRLGRFLSVDPLMKSYPWYTPYSFAGNKPIVCVDLDGEEEYHYLRFKDKEGKTVLALVGEEDIIETKVTERRLGRGGSLPTKTSTVKNAYKLYTVHQESEYEYHQEAYVYNYDEEQSFKTLDEAKAVTDRNFNFTEEDYFNKMASAAAAYTEGMLDPPSIDWNTSPYSPMFGGGVGRGGRGGKGGRSMKFTPRGVEYHLHHLISKGLGKTIAFVKKAIQGGFKLNGKMNLTPVERFVKNSELVFMRSIRIIQDK